MDILYEKVVGATIKIALWLLATVSQWIKFTTSQTKKTIESGIKALHKIELCGNEFSLIDDQDPIPTSLSISLDYGKEKNGLKEFKTSYSCDLNLHHLKNIGKTLVITKEFIQKEEISKPHLYPYRRAEADPDIIHYLRPAPDRDNNEEETTTRMRKCFHKIGPYMRTFTFKYNDSFCDETRELNNFLILLLESFPNLSNFNLTLKYTSEILDPRILITINRFPITTRISLKLKETTWTDIFEITDYLNPNFVTIVFENVEFEFESEAAEIGKSKGELMKMVKWFKKSNSQVMNVMISYPEHPYENAVFENCYEMLKNWKIERIRYAGGEKSDYVSSLIPNEGAWRYYVKSLEIDFRCISDHELFFYYGDFPSLEHLKLHWCGCDADSYEYGRTNSRQTLFLEPNEILNLSILNYDDSANDNSEKFEGLSTVVVTLCFESLKHRSLLEPFFPCIRTYVRELIIEID